MKQNLGRRSTRYNFLAFCLLFVGYFLTTGTELIEGESAKSTFRLSAFLIFLTNVIINRTVHIRYVLGLFVFFAGFSLSQSLIAVNIVFLLLISASLKRLSERETAIVLFVPTLLVVLLHIGLLNLGALSSFYTNFEGRVRSALGFANANQASMIYISLAMLSLFTHAQFRTRLSSLIVLLSFSMAFAVFYYTNSRTSIIALLLLVLFQVLNSILIGTRLYRFLISFFGALSPILACAVTYYLTKSVDPILNILLSLRPQLFADFLSGVSAVDIMFGWRTDGVGVDNLFLMVLSSVGIFGLFFIIWNVSLKIFKMTPQLASISVVLMTISIVESSLIRPEIPVSAFFFHILVAENTSWVGKRTRRFARLKWV